MSTLANTKRRVEVSVEIHAPVSTVWRMFDNPSFTSQIGGEYVSDWKVGSHLGWKGSGGQMLTDGVILQIEPGRLLQHSLLTQGATSDDSVMSVITYEFQEKGGRTTIHAREEYSNPVSDQEYADALDGWGAALGAVKEMAEKQTD